MKYFVSAGKAITAKRGKNRAMSGILGEHEEVTKDDVSEAAITTLLDAGLLYSAEKSEPEAKAEAAAKAKAKAEAEAAKAKVKEEK